MPTYYYKCTNCNNKWTEFWKSINNPPPEAYYCPRCGSKESQKIYGTPPSLKFKADGYTLKKENTE